MRHAVDVVEFGLAVPVFAVVYQPAHPTRLFGGVHAAGWGENIKNIYLFFFINNIE